MADRPPTSEIKLWSPSGTDQSDVLCRGVLKSGFLWVRVAVRSGPAGITVSYPNRRGKALGGPEESDRAHVDRYVIAEARRGGWVR